MVSRVSKKVQISGIVQGVGFRQSTLRQVRLQAPNVTGYVKNLPDGRVEALFCGPEDEVLRLLEWCKHGPPSSQVDDFEITSVSDTEKWQSFEITH